MLLTADVGNSHIRFAFFDRSRICARLVLSSRTDRSRDELALLLGAFARERKLEVDSAALASVVPVLTDTVCGAIGDAFGAVEVLTVRHGLRTGLDIRTDYQTQLGADIVANAVGARTLVEAPYVVVDLGTATTISLVDVGERFCGVAIMPGLTSSARALGAQCASLPQFGVGDASADCVLGKNTADSLAAGLTLGTASMVEGMIARVGEKFSCAARLSVVLCGGGAELIAPYLSVDAKLCPDLTSIGLCRLWEINRNSRHR